MAQARTRSSRRSREVCCAGLAKLLSPRLFKALGDPRRVELLVRLVDAGGPCTVSAAARGSGVDLSVVSRHLAVLRDAGIIRSVKRGKEVWCTVQGGALARLLRDLADALEVSCLPEPGQYEGSASPARHEPPPRVAAAARRSPVR